MSAIAMYEGTQIFHQSYAFSSFGYLPKSKIARSYSNSDFFFNLLERVTERVGEKEGIFTLLEKSEMEKKNEKSSSTCWFIPQMSITARTGPGQKQEVRTQPLCLMWVVRDQNTWAAIWCLPVRRNLMRSRRASTQPRLFNMGCEQPDWSLYLYTKYHPLSFSQGIAILFPTTAVPFRMPTNNA